VRIKRKRKGETPLSERQGASQFRLRPHSLEARPRSWPASQMAAGGVRLALMPASVSADFQLLAGIE